MGCRMTGGAGVNCHPRAGSSFCTNDFDVDAQIRRDFRTTTQISAIHAPLVEDPISVKGSFDNDWNDTDMGHTLEANENANVSGYHGLMELDTTMPEPIKLTRSSEESEGFSDDVFPGVREPSPRFPRFRG